MNNSVFDALTQRRMTRRFLAQPLDAQLVEQLLTAACHAPSPHNRQPWRFAIISGDARARLALAMGMRLRADLARDGVAHTAIEADATRSFARITGAPTLILACLSMRDMDVYPDARRAANERWMAGQAVAAAIQNILISAQALGLGACWMCAPLFCPDTVRDTLKLPADWEAQALIALGHPDGPPRERPRLPLNAIALTIST
jgi:coenzyme F420-0:L-glutamate ligase / coenzyme F420-1:gamma-L-glutamate ligase